MKKVTRKHINTTNIIDGSTRDYLMRNSKFSVGFNMPEALSGDQTFKLPPYAKIMSYLVDKYPACPKNWLRSEGIVKSFFVPVIEGKGMWLDFNENENHTHHMAIVISIQGVNPITGLPCRDAQLEQYIEECPKHKIKFGPDRYCSKCDYKWPKQNYVCTTGTPRGRLWLDGFRTAEGVVRQYILTAEKMRGVASNIVGKDRVYAIGLSFFVSKEKKPKVDNDHLRGNPLGLFYSPAGSITYATPPTHYFQPDHLISYDYTYSCDDADSLNHNVINSSIHSNFSSDSLAGGVLFEKLSAKKSVTRYKKDTRSRASVVSHRGAVTDNIPVKSFSRSIQPKKLEVGAGAKIDQMVYDDPERLDFWHDKPESIICVNYCDVESCKKILEEGEIDIEGHDEAFLKEIPVGN